MNNIKVFIVDESLPFMKFMEDGLSKYEYLKVVGSATDFAEARTGIVALKPDVVICSIRIMNIDGLKFIRKMMREHPVKIITVSTVEIGKYKALSAGSISFVQKPAEMIKETNTTFFMELASNILQTSKIPLNRFLGGKIRENNSLRKPSEKAPKPKTDDQSNENSSGNLESEERRSEMLTMGAEMNNEVVIAIGASTGGTEALLEVLRDLPENTPGIVIVQHMPPGFTSMFASRLNNLCKMSVKEAQNGDRIEQGKILVAPGDLQMYVVDNGSGYSVKCVPGDKVSGHRPSVDVLFTSMANVVGASAIGVILTGMGGDGAQGLLEMKKQGAYTIGQNKESSVVYGMPMVAFNLGAVCKQLPLKEISSEIVRQLSKM